jgi:hypothetical protein
MWNSTWLISVFIIVDLIDDVELMLNYTFTCPLVALLSVILLLVQCCKAWNCL